MATIYFTACSLDGYVAGPGADLTWLVDTPRERADDTPLSFTPFVEQVGAAVMGRGTYDWLVVAQGPEAPVAPCPTWVLTHRPGVVTPGVEAYAGDLADLHARLVDVAAGRHVWVMGGGDVAGQLLDLGLLDEVWVQYTPVTLGAGSPLLPRRADLRLLDAARNGDFVDTHYAVVRP